MIRWTQYIGDNMVFARNLEKFANRELSLNNLRYKTRKNSKQRKLIYQLERIGVNVTRPLVRKAVNRVFGL